MGNGSGRSLSLLFPLFSLFSFLSSLSSHFSFLPLPFFPPLSLVPPSLFPISLSAHRPHSALEASFSGSGSTCANSEFVSEDISGPLDKASEPIDAHMHTEASLTLPEGACRAGSGRIPPRTGTGCSSRQGLVSVAQEMASAALMLLAMKTGARASWK